MQISYSRIGTFESCPFKYDLLYNQKLGTIFNCDPTNALVLGTALHTGIEKDVKTAIEEYYSNYPIVNDLIINEAIKLENLIPKAANMLPEGEYEVKIDDEDFVGFIDLLAPCEDNTYDIYDFKYSNNVERYLESEQLHLYKYFFEKQNPTKRIRNLYYVIVPKTMIRQKKTEDLYQFRKRLQETLKTMEPQIIEVKYDYTKVIEFLLKSKKCIECTDYQKNPTRLCDWCQYQLYCEKGIDYEIIYPWEE